MIELDGGERDDARMVVQEVVVELVGLVDEVAPLPRRRLAVPVGDDRADLDGGVQPARDGQRAEQRRRRAFAMDARDRDADRRASGSRAAPATGRRECPRARRHQFRMLGSQEGHRGPDDEIQPATCAGSWPGDGMPVGVQQLAIVVSATSQPVTSAPCSAPAQHSGDAAATGADGVDALARDAVRKALQRRGK